mmetsp:Transcript_44668/g.90135  ORF Transcript_44668/g.90135 Transcript_44668/m.90135 type:complete len:205 (-) Transcript_44668:402-1016(-)
MVPAAPQISLTMSELQRSSRPRLRLHWAKAQVQERQTLSSFCPLVRGCLPVSCAQPGWWLLAPKDELPLPMAASLRQRGVGCARQRKRGPAPGLRGPTPVAHESGERGQASQSPVADHQWHGDATNAEARPWRAQWECLHEGASRLPRGPSHASPAAPPPRKLPACQGRRRRPRPWARRRHRARSRGARHPAARARPRVRTAGA